jgi:hypothetical protein
VKARLPAMGMGLAHYRWTESVLGILSLNIQEGNTTHKLCVELAYQVLSANMARSA